MLIYSKKPLNYSNGLGNIIYKVGGNIFWHLFLSKGNKCRFIDKVGQKTLTKTFSSKKKTKEKSRFISYSQRKKDKLK